MDVAMQALLDLIAGILTGIFLFVAVAGILMLIAAFILIKVQA